eukprot:6307105-Pyramimonas_sp.AAC.1
MASAHVSNCGTISKASTSNIAMWRGCIPSAEADVVSGKDRATARACSTVIGCKCLLSGIQASAGPFALCHSRR